MHSKTTTTRAILNVIAILLLSVFFAVTAIVYYIFYALFNLVLNPELSVFGATLCLVLVFIGLIINRRINGKLITPEMIENSQFYQKEPDIQLPDIEDLEDQESESVIKTEQVDTSPSNSKQLEEITDEDIPRELYIKIVQNDDYTLQDAKQEYLDKYEET